MSYRHFRNLRKSVGTLQYLMNNLSMVQDSHPCLSGLLAFKLNFFLSHDQIVNIINLSYQIRHYHTCILINFFFTEIGQQQNSICCPSSEEQSQSYRMRKHMEIRYMYRTFYSASNTVNTWQDKKTLLMVLIITVLYKLHHSIHEYISAQKVSMYCKRVNEGVSCSSSVFIFFFYLTGLMSLHHDELFVFKTGLLLSSRLLLLFQYDPYLSEIC